MARLGPISSGQITAPPSPATAPRATWGIGQLGRFGRDRHVTQQCDVGGKTERVTVDGGDDRLFDIEQVLDHPPAIGHHDSSAAAAFVLGRLVTAGQIAAHGKRLACPGQQNRVDVTVLGQVQPDLLELVVECGVNRVALVGSVNGHRGHPVGDLDVQILVVRIVQHGFMASFCSWY